MQGPDPLLKVLGATFTCPVERGRPALIEARLRYHLNHEIFYFSSREAFEKFRIDPLRYCGLLTDPVNHVRFQPRAASPKIVYGNRIYYFTSDSTRVRFQAYPDSFAVRRGA